MSPWGRWLWRRAVRRHYATLRRAERKEDRREMGKALKQVMADIRRLQACVERN